MKYVFTVLCYVCVSVVFTTLILSASCKRCPSSPTETDCKFVFIPHDTPPRVKDLVLPEYPEELRQQSIEGIVVLHLFINEEGYVTNACVAQSLHPLLDEAALEAAKRTTFYPALKDGEPIGFWIVYPVRFQLED